MELAHFGEDVNKADILVKLAAREFPTRLLTAEELGIDFFLQSFEFPVVVLTEKGAICILPHPGYEALHPQFCFGRWSSVCRFPVVKCS